jgi:urea transport system ATP-binding protein
MLNVDGINLYYGASHALRRVSLSAAPGRVTCVLGRNGVGKTTLMRAIMGLQAVKTGTITWEGKDITALAAHQRARCGIGFVPQGREIFAHLTVKENLETGFAPLPSARRTIPDEIFELFPVLKSMLSRRGGDLSGGQQQQLAIARALVTRPRLLILDEPTEGIQPSIIKDIGRVIRLLAESKLAEWSDMTVVLVEQYFDFAKELADDFAVMDRGEVVLAGQAASMVEDNVRRYLTV